MSTSDAPNLRRLARQLADYGRRLRHLETVPQLAHSSLDNQGMAVYDADGNLSVTLGKQSDGTYSARPVAGPIPPAPVGLDAEGDAGLVHASWQGVFWAGAAMPRDFEAVEVLVDGNVHGAIHDPDGGSVTVPAFAGEREVSFRTLSQAGQRSDATGHVTVTVQSKASVQLDEARGRIEDAEQSLGETQVRLDQAEQTVASTAEDLTRIETEVIPGVVADLNEAIDNIVIDDAGAATYQTPYEPDANTDPPPKAGDIWFDTSDNMKLHRHDGTQWVSAADERIDTIRQAQDDLEADIDAVRTSANGKNAVHWSTSTPPNEYDGVVDDTWFRMSSMGSGGRVVSQWRWNGAVWVSTVVDNAVIANLDAGKITSGFIDAERFKAGSISASSIAVGDFSNLATIDPIRDVNVSRPSSWATETVDGYITPKASSQNYLMFKDRTDTVPFKGGDRLRIEFKAVAEVDGDAVIRLWGYPDVADGSTSGLVGVSGSLVSIGTAEQSFTAYVTIPESFGVSTVLRSWIFGLGPSGGSDLHKVGVRDVTAYRMTGATLIEDGAITTDKIATGAITAESGIIESLNAGVITVGEMSGARIEAGTVTADKLLVSDRVELAASPAQYPGEWQLDGGAYFFDWAASYDGKGLRLEGTDPAAYGPYRATVPGEKWWVEAFAGRYSGATADAHVRVYFYDADRAYITSALVASGAGSLSGVATAPAGSVFARFGVRFSGELGAGWLSVRDMHGRRQASATLIEDGAITTDKLTVTGDMSAAIVNAMSVNAKKLVVTEEAILNHATLIGDTVVDNINVTGKLIGTDGVFTGTVDFENVNVTGQQLVERLEAHSISADMIEGGSFTGESFTGGTFTGGEFRTSDALPGQVRLADDGYVTHLDGGGVFPGIGVTPLDDTDMLYPAGIGPSVNGLTVYGGKRTTGGTSIVQANPTGAFLRVFREDGAAAGEMQTSSAGSYMRTYREDGTAGGVIQTSPTDSLMRTYSGNSLESGWVRVQPQDTELAYVAPNNTYFSRIRADASEAFIFTRAGGANRYLSVDADGVWVKTNKSGSWKYYNLEETAQDSGWNNFAVSSGLTLNEQTAWRNKGGIIWLAGRVRADWAVGAWTDIATLPAALRPSRNIRATAPIDGRPTHLLEINTAGALRLYRPPNDAGGAWSVQISTLMWPTG